MKEYMKDAYKWKVESLNRLALVNREKHLKSYVPPIPDFISEWRG